MYYLGGKASIVGKLAPVLQGFVDDSNAERYIEPFVGGANVIYKIHGAKRYGFDINKYLIALLRHVSEGGLPYTEVSSKLYSSVRAAYKNGDTSGYKDWQVGNVGLLSSYNGKWFGGYTGQRFRNWHGKIVMRNDYIESVNSLLRQAEGLKDVTFGCCDYSTLTPKLLNSKFRRVIYCDPPYAGTTGYSFSYDFNSKKFWDVMRGWAEYNIVLVSEQAAPDDFVCIWEMPARRTLGVADNSRMATEKLFMYRYGIHGY